MLKENELVFIGDPDSSADDPKNFKLKIPPNPATIVNYLTSRMYKSNVAGQHDKKTAPIVSAGTIASDIAMIKSLLFEAKTVPSTDLEVAFKGFASGYRKTVADRKYDGLMKQDEGKDQLPYPAIQEIVEFALSMRSDPFLNVFGCMQILMQFSLICRSVNTGAVTLTHISWEGDAQTVILSKDKCTFFFVY